MKLDSNVKRIKYQEVAKARSKDRQFNSIKLRKIAGSGVDIKVFFYFYFD